MTSPTRLLRYSLLMPDGTPDPQGVAPIERKLRSGKERVRPARASVEKSHELRATFAKTAGADVMVFRSRGCSGCSSSQISCSAPSLCGRRRPVLSPS
jgi:hypothetical protein